jgi:anti-sigma regulatory factor (Ser/Thr protein kinase)
MRLSADPASARAARAFVLRTLEDWHCAHLGDTAKLLTSELVGNVVRHAHTDLLVAARLEQDALTVEVVDESPDTVARRDPALEDPTGRGLFLVDTLADRWGVHRRPTGKSVWFELGV